MTNLQFLLLKLSEECKELGIEADKAIQFGLDSFNPELENASTNLENLKKEFNDILTVVQMINTHLVVLENRPHDKLIIWDDKMFNKKRNKLLKYKQIAIDNGTLVIDQ